MKIRSKVCLLKEQMKQYGLTFSKLTIMMNYFKYAKEDNQRECLRAI